MPRFTLANPGVITFFDADLMRRSQYGISTIGPRNLLQTTQYRETGPERDDVRPFEPSSWGVAVPAGAEIFAATGGVTAENARQFWVGWLVGKRVAMQALMQQHPVETELAADETPTFPAVMDNAGVAALYSWRPAGDATALWRRLFTGQLKTKPTVAVEALTEIPGRPVVSVVGAIPGDRTQHAVIGWAEDAPAGAVLGMAIVRPTRIVVERSAPVPDFSPFARQRPGVWASAPPAKERYELTVALQSRGSPHRYATARFSIGATPEERNVSTAPIALNPDHLHAAAFDYSKDHVDPFVNEVFLTNDGRMWIGHRPEARRQGLPLGNPLPVLATTRVYWGVRDPDGSLRFESF